MSMLVKFHAFPLKKTYTYSFYLRMDLFQAAYKMWKGIFPPSFRKIFKIVDFYCANIFQ